MNSRAQTRILAIGGSTTECLYLDDSEAWPYRVQEILNAQAKNGRQKPAWVGNAGKSGLRARHHIVQAENLLRQTGRYSAILIMLGANDFGARLVQDSAYTPTPFNAAERQAAIEQAFALWPHAMPLLPWHKQTQVWGRFRRAKRGLLMRKQHAMKIQDNAGSVYRVWRSHRASASEIRDALPDFIPALLAYERDLREITETAHKYSVHPVFMTQPCLWKGNLSKPLQDLLWYGGTGDYQNQPGRPYYSAKALQAGLEQYNEALRRFCRAHQLTCIDMAALLPKDTTVFYDDMHFNTAGSNLVAQIVADRVRSLGLGLSIPAAKKSG